MKLRPALVKTGNRWFLGAVFLLFGLAIFSASGTAKTRTQTAEPDNPSPAAEAVETTTPALPDLHPVLKVIDGDTLQVELDGRAEVVRLIGVDTPESVDPRKPVQCFAQEATNKAKEILLDKKVKLESDPTQGDRDKYNRLLRYAFLENGKNLSELMISEGFAHEYTYQTPYKYRDEFKAAEAEAKAAKRGLWADATCVTAPTAAATAEPNPNVTAGPTAAALDPNTGNYVCGAKTKCGEMVSCVEAMFYLNTCGLSRLDGDKDGVPCETLCN